MLTKVAHAVLDIVTFTLIVAVMLLVATKSRAETPEQMQCLALNIYHEARSETAEGQLAVAHTTLNRVASSRFPNTICKVVKQARYKNGKLLKHKCQFSWYCDGASDKPKDIAAWEMAQYTAKIAVKWYEQGEDFSNGALFYHAHYVSPSWSRKFTKVATVDSHVFYDGVRK